MTNATSYSPAVSTRNFSFFKVFAISLLILLGSGKSWGSPATAIYTIASKTTVTTTGTAPSGSSATYSQTYSTVEQMTNGNSTTLTLTGYAGYKITSIVLNMHSNSSSGSGSLSVVAGSTTISSVATAAFNDPNWNGSYTTSFTNITKTPSAYTIGTGENIVITIAATSNSLFIHSYSVTYDIATGEPLLSSPTVTVTSPNAATLGANITSTGTSSITASGTAYKTTTGVTATDNASTGGPTVTGAFTQSRTGFNAQTQYYFVGYATNGSGTSLSTESSFYTFSNAPTLQAGALTGTATSNTALNITWTAATFPTNGATTKGYVLLRATSPNTPSLSNGNGSAPVAGTNTTIVSSTIAEGATSQASSGLTTNTTYNYLLVPFCWDGTNAATYNYLTASAPTVASTTFSSASAVTVVAKTTNSMDLTWTNGNGSGRIVVARATSSTLVAPTNGTLYIVNSNDITNGLNGTTGTGNVVVYSGTGNSTSVTGLTAGTQYQFYVYEYNSASNYATAASSGATYTLAAEPTTQSSGVSFSSISASGFTIDFTKGDGANRVVLVKSGSPVNDVPVDATTYTTASFGSGTQIGTGNYVVYSGTAQSVGVTGLSANTTYYIAIYEFNGSGTTTNYLTSSPATGNQITLVTAPAAPTNLIFGSITYNSLQASFTAPGIVPDGYLVMRRKGAVISGTPVGGTVYSAGQSIGAAANEIIYVGTSPWTNENQTSLTDYTTYYYAVYSYAGTGTQTNYSIVLTGSQTTSAIPATTANAATNISSTGFTANWDAVAGATNGYLLDVSTTSNFGTSSPATLTEGFETGLTSNYITNGTATLGSGVWSFIDGGYGNTTSGNYRGTTSCQLKATTGTASAPALNNITTLSFWAKSTGTSIKVNKTVSGTTTTVSTITITNTLTQYNVDINDNSSNIVISFVNNSGNATYIDDIVINYSTITPSFVTGFNAKAISGQSTVSSDVSGLSANTTYYYRIRSVGANSTSANSGTITVVTKAVPTLSISNSPQTYTGSAIAATVTGSVAGTVSNIKYNGSATAPTAPGSYPVTADFVPTDATNYSSLTGASAGTFVINKATPTLTVTNTPVTYDGTAKAATASALGGGLVSNISTGGAANQTNAGTYIVTADIAASTNYNAAIGVTASNSFVIVKANQSITFGALSPNYVGDADYSPGATSATSGTNAITYSSSNTDVATIVSGKIHIVGAGTTTITASQAASDNYNAATATQDLSVSARSAIVINTAGQTADVLTDEEADVTVKNNGELTIDDHRKLHSITVEAGGKLTVADGKKLTAPVSLQSSSLYTATFVDYSTSDTPPAITGSMEQYLPQGRNWYITSPVVSGNTSSVSGSGLGFTVSYYNEATSAWVNDYSGALTRGVGYVAVSNSGTGTNNATFSGTFHSGPVTVPLTRKGTTKAGFNLVANPYPSYLNAMTAINANANIMPTIWYRTRSTGVSPQYHFETVNTTSGEGTNASLTGTVSGYIPPMQAFWVRTLTDDNSITFTNAMRLHHNGSTTVMKTRSSSNDSKLLRLQVSNGVNADEAIVMFNTNAMNGYDKYDSPKNSNNSSVIPEIYTKVADSDEQLVINGMNSIPLDTEIPLGFNTKSPNNFRLKASEFRNFDSNVHVMLLDKQNTSAEPFDLTDGSEYSFSSDATDTMDRFSVIFKAVSISTGVNTGNADNFSIWTNATNQLVINGCAGTTAAVYNAVGQKLSNQRLTSTVTVLDMPLLPGVYMVTVSNAGKSVTKKVIVK